MNSMIMMQLLTTVISYIPTEQSQKMVWYIVSVRAVRNTSTGL